MEAKSENVKITMTRKQATALCCILGNMNKNQMIEIGGIEESECWGMVEVFDKLEKLVEFKVRMIKEDFYE